MTGKKLINKGIDMKRAIVVILAFVFTVLGADCEQWVSGARGYVVGETCLYEGEYYVCINNVDPSTSPASTWFWEKTDQCGGTTGLAPTSIELNIPEVDRNSSIGDMLAVVTVTDPDSGDVVTISLSDDTASDNHYFSIVDTNLVLDSTLEDIDTVTIIINATDSYGLSIVKQFQLPVVSTGGEDYTQWLYHYDLILNTSETGQVLDSTLYDQVLLVKFDTSWFDFSLAQSSGQDIRFESFGGEKLTFQIEEWDSISGVGAAWVELPELLANSETQFIRVYYGNIDAVNMSLGDSVFDSVYSVVLHGDSDTSGNLINSTGGTITSDTTLLSAISSIAGTALVFTENSTPVTLIDSITTSNYISMIIKPDSLYQEMVLLDIADTSGSKIQLSLDSLGILSVIQNDTIRYSMDSISIDNSIWTHVMISILDSSITLYKNGDLCGSLSMETVPVIEQVLLGSSFVDSMSVTTFKGYVDEVRIGTFIGNVSFFEYADVLDQGTLIFHPANNGAIATPSDFKANLDTNGILLTWIDNADNEQGYELTRFDTSSMSYVHLATLSENTTSYIHDYSTCGESIEYRLKAYHTTDESPVVLTSITTTPCTPDSLLAYSSSPDVISLSWSIAENMTGVTLEGRIDTTADWTVLYTGAEQSFNHQGVQCGVTYYYRYKVFNMSGGSEWSPITQLLPAECLVISPDNLSSLNNNSGYVALNWRDNSNDENGFYIYRKAVGESAYLLLDSVTANTTAFEDISTSCSNRKYEYYVQAFNLEGKSGSSNTVTIHTEYCGNGKSGNELISFDVVILDSTNLPLTGFADVTVKLYNGSDVTTALYIETLYKVEVRNGFTKLILGIRDDIQSILQANDNLFYDVICNNRSIFEGELQPVTSVPYTMQNSFSIHGRGTPIDVPAPVGATYVDTQNQSLYFKVGQGNGDWVKVGL